MIEEMKIEDLVNFQDLKLVLSDFTAACNMRVNLHDRKNRTVLEFYPKELLGVVGEESLNPLFLRVEKKILEGTAESVIIPSEPGLHTFLVPVTNQQDVIGYLVGEPIIIQEEDRDKLKDRALELQIPGNRIRKWLRSIRQFNKESFRAKQRFLETAIRNLVRSKIYTGELAEVNHLLTENEELRRKTEGRLKTLSTLFSISRTFNSSLEPEEVLQNIITSVTSLLKVEICSIMLFNNYGEELRIAAAQGLDPDVVRNVKVKIGEGISGHVAKFRSSLLIADIASDPRFSDRINKAEYRTTSALSVPILRRDALIGVINVNNKMDGQIFTPADQEMLEAIADQTAVAVMNARHHDNFRKKVRELEYLNNISQMVQSTLDLDKLLKVTLDLITDLMEVENCSLMLINDDQLTMSIVIANGLAPEIIQNAEIIVGEGISGKVAATGEPLLIRNIESHEEFEKRSSVDYTTRSALSVPLKVKDRTIGVINVNNKKSGEIFSNTDLQLLETLSSQISAALENARLYNQMQQKIIELTMLQEVGHVVNSTLDLSNVLSHVIEQILKIFDADMGSLMLYDEKNQCLNITEQKGIDQEYAADVKFKPGEGIAGMVFTTGEEILVRNSYEDDRYLKFGDEEDKLKTKTLMCCPIYIKGKVEGVLSCEKRLDHTGAFTEENLNLMMTISSQASVAIENANLYNELLSLYLHTIESLAAAIDAKDSYTHGHSRRVMDYSIAIAAALGMEKTNLNTLRHTALLHDIGKIGISEAILQKPGKLTNEEFDYIKGHPVVGAHILESIEFLKEVRMQMKHHHEKYDGSGYPDGLKGEEIPLGARIIAVADTYDAMTSTRSYRRGLEHQLAVEEIARCSGTQFDPEIVAVFLKIEDDVRKYNDNLEENRTPLPLVIKQSMMQ